MYEENMMDAETPQTTRSESAFSGTSSEEIHRAHEETLKKPDIVHAIPYNHSWMFYIPKRLIPVHESLKEIIETLVSRGKNPKRTPIPLYTMHESDSRKALVSLFQVKTRHRERFNLYRVSVYSTEDMIRDFNVNPPDAFKEAQLSIAGPYLRAKVDGRELDLVHSGLKTFQGEVMLDCKIEGRSELRLRRGIHGFRIQRLPGREPVTSIRAREDALILDYRTSKKWKEQATRVIELAKRPIGDGRPVELEPEIRLTSEPSVFEGYHLLEIPPSLEKDARDRIRIATSAAEHSLIMGEIGETIIDVILQKLNCPEVTNHPASKSTGRRNSEKKGPDSLRLVPNVGLGYFEVKWWKQFHMAMWEARRRVRIYCQKFRGPDGQQIKSGYAAVLDWQIGSLKARLYIERVV